MISLSSLSFNAFCFKNKNFYATLFSSILWSWHLWRVLGRLIFSLLNQRASMTKICDAQRWGLDAVPVWLILWLELILQLESLPAMVSGIWSDDFNIQVEATHQFRKLLSIGKQFYTLTSSLGFIHYQCISRFFCFFFCDAERNPPIQEVIDAGVVPRFVQFLLRNDFPQLQVLLFI